LLVSLIEISKASAEKWLFYQRYFFSQYFRSCIYYACTDKKTLSCRHFITIGFI